MNNFIRTIETKSVTFEVIWKNVIATNNKTKRELFCWYFSARSTVIVCQTYVFDVSFG